MNKMSGRGGGCEEEGVGGKGAGSRTNEYQLTLCSALQRACY